MNRMAEPPQGGGKTSLDWIYIAILYVAAIVAWLVVALSTAAE